MNIEVKGDISGSFDLLYFSPGTASISISSYKDYIYNVLTVDSNQNTLIYNSTSNTNPFTHFEADKYYFIFSKKNFTLTVADYTQDKFIIEGNSQGIFSFFKFPFNTSIPLTAFANKFEKLQETTVDRGTITTYDSLRPINSIKSLKKDRIYFIKAIEDFIIYNRDLFALQQESGTTDWILQENGVDRLLLE
jgi:hypothetical protein